MPKDLEFEGNLQIDPTASQEVGDRVKTPVHILDPIVVDGVVDAQQVEDFERDKSAFRVFISKQHP